MISLLINISCFSFSNSFSEEQHEKHFYFVQITDTHFGDDDHLDRTQKVVERINDLPMKIKCVVHTGDIAMDNLEDKNVMDSGLSIMEKLSVPIHYISGNHDILPQKLESTCKAYLERFGGMISQAEYDNVLFMFVYTEPLRLSFTIEGYQPLKQLEEYLKNSKGKPVIIFHHAPSVDDFYENKFHTSWEMEMRKKWVRVINAYNVKAVIAGHFHRDEHHWLGNVPLYVSPPIAGYWGRQASFRIFEYHDGKLGYRTQYIQPFNRPGVYKNWFLESKRIQSNKLEIKPIQLTASSGDIGLAFDKDFSTRWESEWSDPQWIEIDLTQPMQLTSLTIYWETAFTKRYEVLSSKNKTEWETIFLEDNSDGVLDVIQLRKPLKTRYLKLLMKERGTQWGHSIWEMELE